MRSIKYIITAILIGIATCAYSQISGKTKMIYIIDGYFFKEIPMDYSLMSGLMQIKTANGTEAMGVSLKKPLPEEAKKYAIHNEQIPEADILLDMYNEKKDRMLRLSANKQEILKAGDKFPEFKAIDINGKTWSSSDIKGKVMVLNCWFTGCAPCRAEMPELSEWKDEMPDVMFFSSTYEKPEIAMPVLKKTGFNWIALVNDTQFKKYLGSNGYPMTVVVDKEGKIAQAEYGTSPTQREKLKRTINSLR